MSRGFRYSAGWSGPSVLLALVLLTGGALAAWKSASIRKSNEASAHQPEQVMAVTTAVAVVRPYRQTTTSIGTVLAMRSITLKNELAGTVRRVNLSPGQIVQEGTVLVGLDVAVEEADLQAQQARAALAETTLERLKRLQAAKATSQEEVDQASAARDVAHAHVGFPVGSGFEGRRNHGRETAIRRLAGAGFDKLRRRRLRNGVLGHGRRLRRRRAGGGIFMRTALQPHEHERRQHRSNHRYQKFFPVHILNSR